MSENFLIIPNPLKSDAVDFILKVAQFLSDKGKKVYMLNKSSSLVEDGGIISYISEDELSHIDMAVILGGDGTVLRNVKYIKQYEIPVFGINFGHMGYLTQSEPEDAFNCLDRILNGDYEIENRIMLSCVVSDGKEEKTFGGINEVVVHREVFSRALKIKVYINENFIESFSADGVLVSTPTGSTAYNMSAGGPVVIPSANNFVITPICAHAMADCSIIASGDDSVRIELMEREEDVSARLIVDSLENCEFSRQVLTIKKSQYKLKLVNLNNNSFYRVLKYKLSKEY